MSSPSANMKRIAELAGVSIATVSLGLRNHPRISAETRARIQKIAQEIGYRSNPMVSTLMAHLRASHPPEYAATLGFINAYPQHHFERISPTACRYLNGARQRALQLGYQLEEFWTHEPGMNSKRLSKVLAARGIAGVVIGPLPVGRGHLCLDWSNLAVAALGYSMLRPNPHRSAHDQFRAMNIVMRQLNRLGYRRIGLAMPTNFDERTDHNYLAGFLVNQHRVRNGQGVPVYIPKTWNQNSFSGWFKEHRPDVIVSPSQGLYDWLLALGVRIPEDVGFVLLDWSPFFHSFAGIDQNSERTGQAAIDLIVGQLHCNERGIPMEPKLVLTGGRWVEGPSVRKVSG